ncbi:MAG: YggU family protein [Chromatiales bacterium]|nr:YggU family protein [Chromatiales bacterium]
MSASYRWQGNTLILEVKVQPRASRDEIGQEIDGRLKVRITAPPVDGKANTHLLRFLAGQFGVAGSRVQLLNGASGRQKRIAIDRPARLPPGFERCT